MSALTDTREIAKRAYDQLRAAMPETYQSSWDELPESVQRAFAFMVGEGSEAACEALMEDCGFEDEPEATCTRH